MPPSPLREGRLSRWILLRVFVRSLLLQAGFNPRTLQGPGYAYAVYPALRALYGGEALVAAGRRHWGLFNTHPYFASALIGGALRLEERVGRGEAAPDEVRAFRDALGGPLAGLGDAFFWHALRPACALVAALTVPLVGLWSVAVFLGLYNAVHLFVRVWLFREGYRRAEAIVALPGLARFASGTRLLRRANALLAGAVGAGLCLLAGRQAGGLVFVGAAFAALAAGTLAGRVPESVLAAAVLALSAFVAIF